MSIRAEADYDLSAPIVLHCVDCRFSASAYAWLECRCPKQAGWTDKAGTGHFDMCKHVREYECHGSWFEARLPHGPTGIKRVLYWLRSRS